jgi:hypothetical protein
LNTLDRLNDDVFVAKIYPSFLYTGEWDFKNSNVINRKTGKVMTNFQAYLLEGIHETHKSRDGAMRSSSWDVYEKHFMAVSMISDYSGASYTKRALLAMLQDDIRKNFPDKYPDDKDDSRNDWTIFYWPYNGEQIVLRVVDENLEPTPIARWFFIDTNYYKFLENVGELQDQAGDYFMKRFFSEAYQQTGRGIHYQTFSAENGQVIEDRPDYKGDPTAVLPPVWQAPDKNFQEYYDQIILDSFKENVDSLVWSYRVYLVGDWNSDDNIKRLYDYSLKNEYFEISDYTEEIVFAGEGFPMMWALKQLDLLDTSSMNQFFADDEYDSDEYLGDECLHFFKILDDIGPSDKKHFVDFIIKDINTIQSELSGLTYRERMWKTLIAIYQNWIGD